MRKLIVGCGYLGRQVARLWLAQGHEVWATTRSPFRARELAAAGLKPVVFDVLQPETLSNCPAADSIFYSIGLDRTAGHSMREVYVTGLTHFLDALQKKSSDCRKFLYASSVSVYAQSSGGWVCEDDPAEPTTDNGRTVRDAENALLTRVSVAIPNASLAILRFAGLYGPGRIVGKKTIEEGTPLAANPLGWLNLIHVEDGARAALAIDSDPRSGGTLNVCDDEPVPRGEYYRHLSRLLGVGPPRFVASADQSNRRISNQRLRQLGWRPRYPSYREGLAACDLLTPDPGGRGE